MITIKNRFLLFLFGWGRFPSSVGATWQLWFSWLRQPSLKRDQEKYGYECDAINYKLPHCGSKGFEEECSKCKRGIPVWDIWKS